MGWAGSANVRWPRWTGSVRSSTPAC